MNIKSGPKQGVFAKYVCTTERGWSAAIDVGDFYFIENNPLAAVIYFMLLQNQISGAPLKNSQRQQSLKLKKPDFPLPQSVCNQLQLQNSPTMN